MKSYAGVHPSDGTMVVINDDGFNKQVIEYTVTKVHSSCDLNVISEMFKNVKTKLDETIIGICVCIPFYYEKKMDIFMDSANKNDLKNVVFIEEYKKECLEAVLQSGCNLKNNELIWACLSDCDKYYYVIHGRNFIRHQLDSNNESIAGLLITAECPPNIILYGCERKYVNHELSDLFPFCKTIEIGYYRNTAQNTALTYAKIMQIMPEKIDSSKLKAKIFNENDILELQKNRMLPMTDIYVAINHPCCIFSAVYYLNGTRKEFVFHLKSFWQNKAKWTELEENLKMVNTRLNGKLQSICLLKNAHISDEEFCQWAKNIGFKKVEVLNRKQADYVEIIIQLPHKIKPNDVVWIDTGYSYEIWHGYIYHSRITGATLEKELSQLKHEPNFLLSTGDKISRFNNYQLKSVFPKCQFFFIYRHPFSNTALIKFSQIMTENDSLNTVDIINKKMLDFDNNAEVRNEEKFTQAKNKQLLLNEENGMKASKNRNFEKRTPEHSIPESASFTVPQVLSSYNNENHVIGIDLGTSRCCAAVNRKNGITTVHLDNKGERLLPSYVAYDEENPIFGQVVINRLRQFSRSSVFDSKRIIGRSINDIEIDSNWPFRISEKNDKVVIEIKKCNAGVQITPEDVAADLLRYIKQKSEEYQGTKLDTVVITVPAAFTNDQKEATIRSARLASWENINLLPEPIAAAFAYLTNKSIPENENILVFDLGGGTLDVCIFKIENNQIKIISNTGDTKLGGRDFDTVLFNNFRNQLDVKHGIALNRDKKFKLITECQQIKEDLSTVACRHLSIDEYDTTKEGTIEINRLDFETMTKPLLNKIKNTISAALQHSKQNPKEINKILLVGGGSRMPMIKTLLGQIFPEAEQCIHENPDEVVAIGAAYYAYSLYSQ